MFARAVVRRALPNSPRYGTRWITRPDGLITFHERGFVFGNSPSALFARNNYEIRRIHDELAGLRATRSLEVGCGFGRLSLALTDHSEDHIAVDINSDALAAARAAYPTVTFREAAAHALPFPDDHFDLVVTWTVLQHVPPELVRQTCAEIVRVSSDTILLCEETRDPGGSGGHTWHRAVTEYEDFFAPAVLKRHGSITEIDRIPGMVSPGEVMLFARS
jgi:ubiquinone/menaquinone biosynthesis C-methylase UbiE